MKLLDYLKKDEGKTLEFKENCSPLARIVQTVVSFANTTGGTIIIGIRDKSKEIVGLDKPLLDEERLANVFADRIRPLLIPDIRIASYRDKSLIIVSVPHTIGPYYIHSEGHEKGVYVRMGSTNRRADDNMIESIRRLANNVSYDELPCSEMNSEDVDFRAASEFFQAQSRKLDSSVIKTLRLVISTGKKQVPTIGAILLFGKKRSELFPDAVISCARFQGIDNRKFLDRKEIDEYLPKAVEEAILFIERHTYRGTEIGRIHRRDFPEYPVQAVREAVINAIVHSDYSIKGMNIKLAIFDDRIEITNPGALPFGLTLESALSGVSKLRNRIIGRVFRELQLIEQWGTGINRIISECNASGLQPPKFEELGTSFRVTLYSQRMTKPRVTEWESILIEYLSVHQEITTKDAAGLWKTTDRTARTRLRAMLTKDILVEIGTSANDPKKIYMLKDRKNNA